MMEKREEIYEGKAKKIYSTDDPDLSIMYFKDDATAFDGKKKGVIESSKVYLITRSPPRYLSTLRQRA